MNFKKGWAIVLAVALAVMVAVSSGCGGTKQAASGSPSGAAGKAEKTAVKYPTKPITVIVPFAPGGGVDVTARLWGKYAEKLLGQSVVIDNRTGGGGAVGHTAGAQAAADGYTLTMLTTAVTWQHLTGKVAFTPDSFKPIAQVTFDPNVLVTKAGGKMDMPVKDFVDYVKKHPVEVNMGLGGRWATHDLARGLLQVNAGLKFNPVFFDGGGPVVNALLGGNVDVAFPYYTEFASQVKAGKLKVLASASDGKHPFLPDAPTLKENGVDVVAGTWRALAAPKDTPDEIVKILADVTKKVLEDPQAQEEFKKAYISPIYLGTGGFQKVYQADAARYKEIVQKLK